MCTEVLQLFVLRAVALSCAVQVGEDTLARRLHVGQQVLR